MDRHRVLCVSEDPATRATVTRSFSDAPVNVVVTESPAAAIDRLEHETFDAVVVDASTVSDVSGLVDDVERHRAETPAFVHWTDDQSTSSLLAEVIATVEDPERSGTIAETVTGRIEAGPLDGVVGTIERRLADATSPGAVERAIRESFTGDDRFAFAWVGEYDRGEREVVPWITDAASVEWPVQRTFQIGDGSQPLLERTMHRRELQVVQNVAENRDQVPLASAAIDRGAAAAAVAPLGSDDERYGVLVVYATGRLTDAERDAIQSVAETASHTLESVAVRGKLSQLEQNLRRYERLVETAGDGMYVLDDEGHFTTVNGALLETTGYTREGVLGEHLAFLFGEEGVDAAESRVGALRESARNTDTIEAPLETKDGRTIPCEIQIALLTHGETVQGSVGVVRDVTERKRRERKLREQNERLDAFARIVSHDLRNPLGVAQGYLELMEETESLEHLENVREGLDRMETIVADVLTIAREGQTAVETEVVDFESVTTDAWENVSTGDASLSVEETASFFADRSRLLRLLENLFRNSVEHGSTDSRAGADEANEHESETAIERGGETVDVRVGLLDSDDEKPRGFYVEDDGEGMPEELRERAFESSVTTSADGFGIGLWVVDEVAKSHDWTTAVTESADGGARFEFRGLDR